ncbi:outer membrane protein [Helicobacter cetorum]|uniref:outer membrane protein n=1 Tax=Helicobacter cetorum TaxID=138563 RepID=UPI003AF03728
MQDVKNPGKSQADYLTAQMNANYTNNFSSNQGANIVGSLGNTFTQYLYSLLGAYSFQGITAQVGGMGSDGPDYQFVNSMLNTNQKNSVVSILTNLASGKDTFNTTYEHMFQELSYLNSINTFLSAMNNILNTPHTTWKGAPYSQVDSKGVPQGSTTAPQSVYNTNYVNFLKKQTKLLGNATQDIMDAIEALGNYNTTNNTETLTNAQVVSLANQVVSTAQNALDTLQSNANALKQASEPTNGNPTHTQTALQQVGCQGGSTACGGVTSTIKNNSASLQGTLLPNAQHTMDKLIGLIQKVESTPYLPQFRAGNSRQTNIMNGFYTKWGYKQFFGKKRNIGLRYYGFFSYNGASVGFRETSNSVGLYTYGVGTDVLYNIFERSYQNKSVNMGVFGGIQLAGETFNSSLKNSQYVNKKDIQSTHFQFLFDLGFRMNFGKLGQKTKRHRQHTVEIGVQVPTIYNTYYKSAGTTVRYFRPYSVYWSYGYSF